MRISDWSSDVCSSDLRPVGTVCAVGGDNGASRVEAEVIGFRNGRTLLMNLGGPAPLLPKSPVRPLGPPGEAEVGAALLGRVVDGAGKPIDGRSEEHTSELQSLMRISYAVFCLKKKKYAERCRSKKP